MKEILFCKGVHRSFLFLPFFFFFFINSLFAQNIIRGNITSRDGRPLAGATVTVKGTNKGTASDSAGRFTLAADRGAVIEVSYIGFGNEDVVVGSQNELHIVLTEAIRNLDEVVMLGYGASKKKDLTGAVSSISEKDFNKGNFISPDQLIQGKAPGVQIINDNGQPGGVATVMIRGNAAVTGTGQPLYVIDGVPLDGRSLQDGNNALNFINVSDIASIDVLKDASATAIYGSRGSFGVIIINTKKGQAGQPKLDIGASVGVSSIMKKIKVLNATQFRQAIKYYGVDPLNDEGGNVDALNSIFQNGLQQNYNVAASGGTENGKYRLSSALLNQDGILINTGFKKYSVDLTTNFKFMENKRLGMDLNIISSQYIQTVPSPATGADQLIANALVWNPTENLRNPDGSPSIIAGHNINPLSTAAYVKSNLKATTVLGSISPYYKFTDWLEYRLLYSINYSAGISRSSFDAALQPYFPDAPPGQAFISNNELTTQQITHTITFNKNILHALHLTALAGYEYMKFQMKGFNLSGNGDPVTGFGDYGLDYTNYIQYSYPGSRSISSFVDPLTELQSFFGRTMFNLKDKYLFTATFRADGSTKFGANNKYGYFPSFSAAWNISKEGFFKSAFINSLKIRAGWGETGNQEFPSGSSQALYTFQNGPGIAQQNNPNPNLKWQSDRQYNTGIDFSIANNRISGTIDYFHKTTTNLLFPSSPIQPAPPGSVFRWINLDGEVINKGLEVLINAVIAHQKDFDFNVSVNASFLKNIVSGVPAPIYTGWLQGPGVSFTYVQVIKNGLPMDAFYTRIFEGLDKGSGQSVYKDSGNTFFYVGDPNPKTVLGFTATLRYKKVSLSANMFGAFGRKIFDNTLLNALNVSGIGARNIALSVLQNPVKEALSDPVMPSSRFVENGNYMKMANLTLSYNFGNIKNAFKGASLYVTARNLFVITRYQGFDPEVNASRINNGTPSLGIGYVEYPTARTINIGINFSL